MDFLHYITCFITCFILWYNYNNHNVISLLDCALLSPNSVVAMVTSKHGAHYAKL